MPKRTPIKVRKSNKPGYPYYYVIPKELSETGKSQKRYCLSKRQGENDVALLRTQKENFGTRSLSMPEADRIEALKCRDLLLPFNVSLAVAVDHYIQVRNAQDTSCAFSKLAEEALAAKRKRNRSERYLPDLVADCKSFAKVYGDTSVCQITAKQVEAWVNSFGKIAPSTYNKHLRQLSTIFAHGVRMRYCESNPALSVEKATEEPAECGILTPNQLECLLNAAPDDLIPMIAIQAFAGLRPSEAARLTFEDIRYEVNDVRVNSRKSRGTGSRYVDIEPNLLDWLTPFKGKTGLIRPNNCRKKWDELRAKVGLLEHWPHDALRHSYGSYHYAKFQNLPGLSAKMGHTNTNTTRRHYLRRIDTPSDVNKYWAIKPERELGPFAGICRSEFQAPKFGDPS